MRKKRKRFEENKFLDHLIEPEKAIYKSIKGKWNLLYFQNNHPITLEIGCGHGAYTIGLAKIFPERNFIGIDIKGDRLWKGAQEAKASALQNVAFLRAQATHLLDFFEQDEVAEVWITFPDPRPKTRDIKRRLTSPRFLKLYKTILIQGGCVHLKTDSRLLFAYTLDLLQAQGIVPRNCTTDLYHSTLVNSHFGIQTTYEKRFIAQGMQIYYLSFALK
ncbi:MAG: tRNA (guanosine(46)-N7)-methyltransferase TrmB [Candidatus Cardinium sp.]|uniref:tRNA (guanosine(46)-N7)-methyltransferase TrmB n=1 Tax=Cardinium endosymbiont of Dermatophagoides farinae TaxID=2597823 RepID=UPI001182E07B|nr:tRNA (guanosine(46)-N7)-methyltransferase TrmB [Cardinium endosymbiont of Dermatophagoides farinae]TSJ80759.1 tRNA (guanosine(46)-N7)-methyltransferase TrmB [Cardinium endosymbiont of Dermatophagoides farinae]UWW96757.1 MAG: tRNA (guanosine(46)-N7)-methyltransferase TrmB [Candidatus Cardinium sp.]